MTPEPAEKLASLVAPFAWVNELSPQKRRWLVQRRLDELSTFAVDLSAADENELRLLILEKGRLVSEEDRMLREAFKQGAAVTDVSQLSRSWKEQDTMPRPSTTSFAQSGTGQRETKGGSSSRAPFRCRACLACPARRAFPLGLLFLLLSVDHVTLVEGLRTTKLCARTCVSNRWKERVPGCTLLQECFRMRTTCLRNMVRSLCSRPVLFIFC